jgi:hypothetical protein
MHKGLKPTETAIIIQAAIMKLSPQQVLLLDRLSIPGTDISPDEAKDFVRRLGHEEASQWLDILRVAQDEGAALDELVLAFATRQLEEFEAVLDSR